MDGVKIAYSQEEVQRLYDEIEKLKVEADGLRLSLEEAKEESSGTIDELQKTISEYVQQNTVLKETIVRLSARSVGL